MSTKSSETLLFGYRPSGPNEPAIEKAVRAAEGDAAIAKRLQEQGEFDASMAKVVAALAPPEDLRKRVDPREKAGRPQFALSALLAASFGLLIILGLAVFVIFDRQNKFPGREAIERMVLAANDMTGVELQPVTNQAGELGDWFYMRGFDAFTVPTELAPAPAVGSRIFKQNGHTVAQIAVDWHQSLIYVFRPEDFGVQLPEGKEWRYLDVGDWAAAVRRQGNSCVVVSMRGDDSELREFLGTLRQDQP